MSSKCFSFKELVRYWQEKIPVKERKKIEEHIYGKEVSIVDYLGMDFEIYDGKGCKRCFKTLAETASVGSEILKHL